MDKLRGLYLHVPFCSVKCFYCDFAAFSGQEASVERYLAALELEAGLWPAVPVDTLYVGGGTPSELSAAGLTRMLGAVARAYGPVERLRESTVEANPESLADDKLDALRAAGVTRLSLGLQAADDRLLGLIGRRHDFAEFLRVYAEARARGFVVGVDLMFALPGQSREDSRRSVEAVLALEPEHMSLYGLQVEDRTLFGAREVEVDEDLARLMWEDALALISSAGLRQYEISNFARRGYESVHNGIYWRAGEYLGLGCGASAHIDGTRSTNLDRLEPYCAAVEAGRRPTAHSERLEGKGLLGERLWLGLRLLEGVDLTDADEAAFKAGLARLEARGWLSRAGRRIRLTREGLFLANRVFEEFVAPFPMKEAAHDRA